MNENSTIDLRQCPDLCCFVLLATGPSTSAPIPLPDLPPLLLSVETSYRGYPIGQPVVQFLLASCRE
jgi:hypothetical protein